MKLGNIPTKAGSDRKSGFQPPPIPLKRPDDKELTKEQYMSLKLRSIPDKTNSPTYELTVAYFDDGTPEEWLKLLKNLKRVFVGQNLTTATTKYAMTRRLLTGAALSQFNTKYQELEEKANATEGESWEEDDDNLRKCLDAVTEKVFPKRALLTQKRYMRRLIRKPADMKLRDYMTRYNELNRYLEFFPPFKENQKLPADKVMEHAEFAIPNSWQQQMVLHGFNAVENTMESFIEFCERLEFSESVYNSTHKGKNANTQKGNNGTTSKEKDGKSKKSGDKRKPGKHYCLYHGENNTHNTDDCKVLKAQAERMANAHANRGGKYKSGDTADSKQKRKEFTSFATNVIEKVIKKMKRAHDKKSSESFNMEEFNYEAFKSLEVSSSKDDTSSSE